MVITLKMFVRVMRNKLEGLKVRTGTMETLGMEMCETNKFPVMFGRTMQNKLVGLKELAVVMRGRVYGDVWNGVAVHLDFLTRLFDPRVFAPPF